MITEGKVKKIDDGKVTVEVTRKGACGENCASCGSCNNKIVEVDAYTDIPVKTGDTVIISSKSSDVYLAMLIIFILPIILPIFTYVIFIKIGNTVALIFTAVSFSISIFLIYFISRSKTFIKKVTPRVISTVSK